MGKAEKLLPVVTAERGSNNGERNRRGMCRRTCKSRAILVHEKDER